MIEWRCRNMLLVKTKVASSPIEGLGLYADEFIKQGTMVWEFARDLDILIDQDRFRSLPPEAQAYISRYAYVNSDTNKYVLCFDDARYFNHSETPNTKSLIVPSKSESIDIAIRDINPGEEITTNYAEFDAEFRQKLDLPQYGLVDSP